MDRHRELIKSLGLGMGLFEKQNYLQSIWNEMVILFLQLLNRIDYH